MRIKPTTMENTTSRVNKTHLEAKKVGKPKRTTKTMHKTTGNDNIDVIQNRSFKIKDVTMKNTKDMKMYFISIYLFTRRLNDISRSDTDIC